MYNKYISLKTQKDALIRGLSGNHVGLSQKVEKKTLVNGLRSHVQLYKKTTEPYKHCKC